MTPPPQITEALDLLNAERESLVWKIERMRAAHANIYTMADEDYHELMGLHKKRDQLMNVLNNMKAYFDAD